MTIGVSKHIKISYRPDMQTAIIRWQQPVTFTEFKLNSLAVLALAKENAAICWLIDCRSKGNLTPEESLWLCQEFYPKALQQVSTQLAVAWLLSPRQMQSLKEENALDAITGQSQDVRRQAFMTELEAVTWLEKCNAEIHLAQKHGYS